MREGMKEMAKARIMHNETLRGLWEAADDEVRDVMLLLVFATKEQIDAAGQILKEGV